MKSDARPDPDLFPERHYQVPRATEQTGVRGALRESFKPIALPADIAKLLARLV